jgi:lipoprotein NlpD
MVSFIAVLVAVLAGAALVAEEAEYVVKKGDTLYGVAKAYGLSLQELLDANKLNAKSSIKAGQKLAIPGKAKPAASPQPSPSPATVTEKYTVQKGDTLYGIARQTGMEFDALLKANKLNAKSAIKVGQVLTIIKPAPVAVAPKPTANPSASGSGPAADPSPSPATSPDAGASPTPGPSLAVQESAAQASEGTMLKTKPYTLGAKLSWPHPGVRQQVDGKLPGLLIRANLGDPVKAVCAGKVIYSNPHGTFGYMVFVQNPAGFVYIYGGNDSSPLRVGDSVKSGDVIGQVGQAPAFDDPEVYFTTWKDGAYLDPSSVPRD